MTERIKRVYTANNNILLHCIEWQVHRAYEVAYYYIITTCQWRTQRTRDIFHGRGILHNPSQGHGDRHKKIETEAITV